MSYPLFVANAPATVAAGESVGKKTTGSECPRGKRPYHLNLFCLFQSRFLPFEGLLFANAREGVVRGKLRRDRNGHD